MKIAIIDGVNQDIGLKILFPEANYFINNIEIDKSESYKYYNFLPKTDWSHITDKNYDILFIVIALYDAKIGTKFYKQNIKNILDKIEKIININNFKFVALFDNYDYDYDPNTIVSNPKINIFFKRNYQKNIQYNINVVPFPFIMFGDKSIIEKCHREMVTIESYYNEKNNRIFFAGSLFNHQDPQYGVFRNRNIIYNNIKNHIYNTGHVRYDEFISILRNSKYCLDLLGVGDPNKRTFEILLSGSLLISEYNELKWPFPEEFSKETIFKDTCDFYNKINALKNNKELYDKCLINQYNIVNKYFNKDWIREYILKNLNI